MVDAQTAVQSLLHATLADIRAKNPSYSMRAFSKKLGIPSSALSEVLSGKRRVSAKLASRIGARLCLSPQQMADLLGAFSEDSGNTRNGEQREYMQINMDQYHLISEWYHFAILSLSETNDFQNDATWIAARLNIPPKTAAAALERLIRIGLLRVAKGGKVTLGAPAYSTSDGIRDQALRASHAQNLELAKGSLELDDLDARDFTSITMAIDPARLPKAKAMTRKFRDQLCAYLEGGERLEVYRLCVQLFPLSHR